jgi:meckelin
MPIYLPYLEVKYMSRLSDYIAEGSKAGREGPDDVGWAMMMFWYLFCFTAYWFIFYKMQYRVYVLLPPNDAYYSNYLAFEVVFGIVLSFQLLFVFELVRTQCNVDYFFIDWETPSRVLRPGSDQVKALIDEVHGEVTRQEYYYKLSVSAWRLLFVTNELNELQTVRYIHTEFTLLFVVFFLVGLKWERLAAAQPNLDIDDTNSPYNSVLRFFLTSFLFLVIGYSQKVIRKLLCSWIPTKAQNFTDLCSISNISVFILDQSSMATTSTGLHLQVLLTALWRNSAKLLRWSLKARQDPEALWQRTNLVCRRVKSTSLGRCDRPTTIATNPVDEEVAAFNTNQRMSQASKMWLYQATLPKDIDFERLEDVRSELNRRFKTYISTVIMDSKTHFLEKTPLQRFLLMPPTDLANLEGSPFFHKDPCVLSVCFDGEGVRPAADGLVGVRDV